MSGPVRSRGAGGALTRPAVAGDAADIAAIHVRSWQQTYRGLVPQDLLDSLDPAVGAVRWRASIEGCMPPASAVVVLVEGGRLRGFAHVCPSRDEDAQNEAIGELTSIYLRPDAWGRGLGTQLLEHVLVLLAEAGNSAATLWVLDGNTRAIRFYTARGWLPDGAVKSETLGGQPVTEIRLRVLV